jgi:hypothetical protein
VRRRDSRKICVHVEARAFTEGVNLEQNKIKPLEQRCAEKCEILVVFKEWFASGDWC